MATPACLTCTKATELATAVTVGNQENVQNALSKHFWFSEHEYRDGILCHPCWQQIGDFHQYYCEISRLHARENDDFLSHFLEVKQEPILQDYDEALTSVKQEDKLNVEEFKEDFGDDESNSGTDSDQDASATDGNDPDFDVDLMASEESPKPEKADCSNKELVDKFIAENIQMKCDTCAEKRDTFHDLQKHSLMTHGKLTHVVCCERKFSYRKGFMYHIQFHVNPGQFRCDVCSKQFRQVRALKHHKETAHVAEEDKKLQCSMCPKRFFRQKYLEQHEKYHRKLAEKKWHCASCDQYFAYESTLRTHNRLAHRSESKPELNEEDCDDESRKATRNLDRKVKNWRRNQIDDDFITKIVDLKCDTCQQKSDTFINLQRHSLEAHNKRATVFCCGTKFTNKTILVDHIQFHVNPEQLQCEVCSKQFRQVRALKDHMDSAHVAEEDKELQCSVCPKKFARQKNLQIHERYHRNIAEKKWHCASCDQYFAFESTLKNHNLSVHGKESSQMTAHGSSKPEIKPEEWGENECDELVDTCDQEDANDSDEDNEDSGAQEVERRKTNRQESNLDRKVKSWRQKERDEKFIAENINLECDTCQQKSDTFSNLQKHSLASHKKRATVFCCDTKFSIKANLIDHIQFHVNPEQLQCKICSKQFRQTRALKGHMATAHVAEEDKELQCFMCPKRFSQKLHLQIHERYHRNLAAKKWYCASCDQYFAFESTLKNHNLSVHDKEQKYVCHVCAKEYHVQSSYKSHVATHDESSKANQKPVERVQCAECGLWVSKKSLRLHKLRHTGSQTCELCGQECRSEMALRYHMKQHRNGDFSCTLCDKTFKQQLTLKEHMASHTGEVLYRCDFCPRTFNSHANRASHRKKMHPKEWLEDKIRKTQEVESSYGVLCSPCWCKIAEFHQFYSEVERIHSQQNQNQLQPDQLLEVKEEPTTAVFVADEFMNEVKSEAEEDAVSSDDDSSGEAHNSVPVSESEDSDKQTGGSDGEDSDYKKPAKVVQKPTARKKRKRTGRRAGRPVEGWQKDIKDEKFIADTVNLECDTCQQKFDTFEEMQKHSVMRHGKAAYVFCCDLKFSRKPRLVDHIQYHLNPAQFACTICSKQFGDREGLKRHHGAMHTAEEDKSLQCSMCPKRFAKKRFLNLHEKYHRLMAEKKWHCATCDRYFAYESLLKHHEQEVHTKGAEYVCHVCAKSYSVYTSYKSHVLTHDEDAKRNKQPSERIQCTECKKWIFKKGLRKHMLRHSGSQRCDICGQECTSVMTLKYHKSQHRKDDLTCSVCEKVFKRPINFREHMASHTGDVLYHCDFCDKTFNSNANRAAHRKKMHPKEWLEDKVKKNPNLLHEQYQQ